MNLEVTANDDGTVNIRHYGTCYNHWWVGEIPYRCGRHVAYIYGKRGGSAIIVLTAEEVKRLKVAREEAQAKATE